jgi:hypothetical protein
MSKKMGAFVHHGNIISETMMDTAPNGKKNRRRAVPPHPIELSDISLFMEKIRFYAPFSVFLTCIFLQ